jgi:hypothetical protein
MVLSPLTDSYLHGDNTLMGHWGLECPLSSPWAHRADIQQSRNLSSRVGRSGALLNHREWLRLLQCILTMDRTQVVKGSASLPLQRDGILARWSFAWRLAPLFEDRGWHG